MGMQQPVHRRQALSHDRSVPQTIEAGASVEPALIERHSIDFIPRSERHGHAWNQGTLWFAANAELTTLAVGLVGITLGLSLFWDLVAVVLGLVFGTLFMAFHSVQGARLGIPQMIQSRPQFGFYGALLPQGVTILLYVGFNVFNTLIAGQALHALIPSIGTTLAIVLSAVLAYVVAFGGYDWIHFVMRWGTWLFIVCFGVFSIGVIFTTHLPASASGTGHFILTPFLVVFIISAGYNLGSAPYVSDLSRYLKPETSSRSCFWWTYAGAGLGGLWMIALGSFLLAGNPDESVISVIRVGGDSIFTGFGTIALILAFLMLIPVVANNMYSGSLASITAADTVKRMRAGFVTRTGGLLFIAVAATVIALSLSQNFLADFSNFLTLLVYFLIPWTSINLVDFYLVRHGHYAITEIFKPNGIYGHWQWRGLVAYCVGFAAMIPFFSTTLYTGPVAHAANGADFSIFVGIPIAGGLYWLFSRNMDFSAEASLRSTEDVNL
jgi:nucleobase:cation symporter-1, NCS1 family